ncbi:MAG: hypothetical protein WD598_16285 [Acidimicrobiia bacterium]
MATLAPPRAIEPRAAKPPSRTRRHRLRPPGLDTLFTAVFALFGWGVGIERLSDNSFFWHLKTGGLILDHGIPHADPFSYTAHGTDWVAQSWLAELLYGAVDRSFGAFGLRIMGGLVGITIAVLAFRLALRIAGERMRASLLTVAALGSLYTIWSERPLLLGVVFLLLVLWVVEVPTSVLGRRPLIALPLIFWLWANVHGTFALGFVYLGLHLVGRWLDGHRPWADRERTLLAGSVLASIATFANPYGLSLVLFPVDLLRRGDVLRNVIEWSSPDFHHVRGYAYALWIVVFAAIAARAANRMSRRDLLVAVPFLLLGLWALRNIALAPLVGLPIAARAVAVTRSSRPDPRRALGFGVVAVLGVLALAIGVRSAGQPDFALDSYPVRAIDAVERQGLLGRRLLVDDADGGYLILRSWPKQRVFFDDRFDMYPLGVINDFTTVSTGQPGWREVLADRDVEVVVWERTRVLTQLLRQDDTWRATYHDKDYVVFVRADIP